MDFPAAQSSVRGVDHGCSVVDAPPVLSGNWMVLSLALSNNPESDSLMVQSVGMDSFRDRRGCGKLVILLNIAKFLLVMVSLLEAAARPH